jgi:hypothetical protein
MSQKIKLRIYPDHYTGPKKQKYTGAEGYSHVNDMVFSDDIRVWSQGKVRRGKQQYPNLF